MTVGRSRGLRCGALLLLLALSSTALAEPVAIDAETKSIRLGKALRILEDPRGKLELNQVTAPGFAHRFTRATEEEPNFGFTDSVYWVRLELVNRTGNDETFLLELDYPLLDRVDLWVEQRDGSFAHQYGGDRFPFHQRKIRHRNLVFPLRLNLDQPTRLFLRVDTESSVQLPLTLWTRDAFQRKDHSEEIVLGLYYGLVLVMLFYNLFVFLSIRERDYLLFVVFLAVYGLTQAALNGLAFEYLWPNSIWWGNSCLPFLIAANILTTLLFARKFLQTRATIPRIDRFLRYSMPVAAVVALLCLALPYPSAIRISVAGCAVYSVVILGSAVYALVRGYRAARFFVLAWVAFFAGTTAHSLLAYGLVPRSWLTENLHQLGSALLVVLLSFALGDRINLIKREKEEAQSRALESERRSLEIERRSKESLEQEVARQTEALRTANERLQELDRQKTLFFQNISHELRSPLTVLINPLERLLAADLKGPPDLNVKERLQAMERNAHRLLRLVNQLLDFARMESGRATPSYEARDLMAFCRPIVDGFQALAVARGIRLELRGPEELEEIYFDPEKLDTVLCNLVSNACKFTDAGGAVLVKVEADDAHARVSVKDNGIGIPSGQLDKIFDRFHQVDDSSRRRYQGTGIGLALARELTEAMGGSISVQSDEGFGSTFTVSLPLGKEHIKDQSQIRKRRPVTEEQQPLASKSHHAATALAAEVGLGASPDLPEQDDPRKPRVLVVEDSPDMRALVAEILRADFRVTALESAEEALTLLKALGPDELPALVISDVMMPGMDGHELLTRLRSDDRTSSIPVMLLTAKAGPERRIESLESGADEYLTKPFDTRELSARARNLVRLKRQERQLLALNRQMEKLNLELERQVRRKSREADQAREMGRYLPPPVLAAMTQAGLEGAPTLGHQRRRLTMFRADLRGFEELTETLEPEDLADRLNGYLSMMLKLAAEHGATVDHFVLGRVSGFFGAPQSAGEGPDARRCARMAVAMYEQARQLCQRWERSAAASPTVAPVPVVVVHSGYATVGNFGSRDHMDYTAVGKVVQEANMLLRAIGAGVVCSEPTFSVLDGELQGEECGAVALRFRGEPIPVYRLAGPARVINATPDPSELSDSGEGRSRTPSSPFRSLAQLDPGMMVASRYRLIEALGNGGMGCVYHAHDEKLELDVALKLIRPDLVRDERRIKRLRDEVRLSRRVTHRNVARIYDIGDWEGGDFVSMEFLVGETLHDRLQQHEQLPLREALVILTQLCAGLAAAHEARVIHRDLKPSNVMLENGGRVVILDFGIARAVADSEVSASGTNSFIGSPHWMAPEQVTGGEVDHRADIYSLGAVAYGLLTGQTLYQGDNAMAVALHQMSTPPPDPCAVRSDLPAALVELLARCLAKKPEERFQSVGEIVEVLGRVQV